MPSRLPTLDKPITDPRKEESISREIGFAGSEFPRGESIRVKSRVVKRLVKESAAPIVPKNNVDAVVQLFDVMCPLLSWDEALSLEVGPGE